MTEGDLGWIFYHHPFHTPLTLLNPFVDKGLGE